MLRIQFGGYVVQQQHGQLATPITSDGVLSELERKGREAELAARPDVSQYASVESCFDIVAVRSQAGGAALNVTAASLPQRRSVSPGIEPQTGGPVGKIETPASVHGNEPGTDGRADASHVSGAGAGDFDGRLRDSVIPELELGRTALAALETTEERIAAGEKAFRTW